MFGRYLGLFKAEVGWGENEISTKGVVDRRKEGREKGRGRKIRLPEVIVLLGNSVRIYLEAWYDHHL